MRHIYILALIFVHSAVMGDQVMFSNGASIVAGEVSLNVRGNYNIDGKVYASGQVLQWLTDHPITCLLYTSPSPRDAESSRMPSSA